MRRPGRPLGGSPGRFHPRHKDEALDAAYEILERAQEEETGAPVSSSSSALSGAVAEALDAGLFSNLFSGLAALPAVPDPSVAPEFV